MKNKLAMVLLLIVTNGLAQADEITVVSEIKKLPNGEIPKIVVHPDYANDKVKEIEIYPFIHGKAKVVMKIESSSTHTPIKKSGVLEVVPSK